MLEPIKTALTRLSAIDESLPWTLLAFGVFALVYLARKFTPKLWLAFEARSPFVVADPQPVLAVLHKAFQALPSVAIGAALPALLSGGDVRTAITGALVGLLPPVMHELAKWAPWLPYRGALPAKPKTHEVTKIIPPGTGIFLLAFAVGSLIGLTRCSGTQPAPGCSDDAYRNQLLNCSVAAASCVQKGGTDDECGSVCDTEWALWQERCSQ